MKKLSKSKNNKLKLEGQDSDVSSIGFTIPYEGQAYDIMLHAWLGKMTGWLSPASLGLAMFDWWSHVAISPAKQFDLIQKSWENLSQFNLQLATSAGLNECCEKINCKPRSQ